MELTWYRLRAGGNEGTLGSENLVQGCRVERGRVIWEERYQAKQKAEGKGGNWGNRLFFLWTSHGKRKIHKGHFPNGSSPVTYLQCACCVSSMEK